MQHLKVDHISTFLGEIKIRIDEGGNNIDDYKLKYIDDIANHSFATDVNVGDDDSNIIILRKESLPGNSDFDESLSPDLVTDVSGNLMGFGPCENIMYLGQ